MFQYLHTDEEPCTYVNKKYLNAHEHLSILYVNNQFLFSEDKSKRAYGGTMLCLHGFPTSGYDWVKVSQYFIVTYCNVVEKLKIITENKYDLGKTAL